MAGHTEDLWFNDKADFTKWVTADGLLHEPFAVVDVGVQGDANGRWNLLGDHLILHGFDAIEEVVDKLKRWNRLRPNRHFHNLAIGNVDQEQIFYFNAANPSSSSMYEQGESRFEGVLRKEARSVTMRQLDTLFDTGVIPQADFLKVDVEGFEKQVFLGGKKLLAAGILGVETETTFGISPTYPKSHLVAMTELLVEHHLLVFDFGFNRVPRASFQRALRRHGLDRLSDLPSDLGKPSMLNVLFCRDLIEERDHQEHYLTACHPVSVDQLIKLMIIYELHGLNDIALDTAERFADQLGTRLDVEQATRTLANPDCRPGYQEHAALVQRIRELERSTSWRITAPLRAAKRLVIGS
jgi:FkbM family methyltransferase